MGLSLPLLHSLHSIYLSLSLSLDILSKLNSCSWSVNLQGKFNDFLNVEAFSGGIFLWLAEVAPCGNRASKVPGALQVAKQVDKIRAVAQNFATCNLRQRSCRGATTVAITVNAAASL